MYVLTLDYSRGVAAVADAYEAEVARLQAAGVAMRAYLDSGKDDPDRFDQLNDDLLSGPPLWRQISGVHFWAGEDGLADRRAGMQRLLNAVEQMYRGELAVRHAANKEGVSGQWTGNPPAFYDPLREICHFLQLPLSKVSQLCLEHTGLRINELGDVIRAEGFRSKLEGLLRPLAAQWWAGLSEKESSRLPCDVTEVAGRFLKWVRGRGRAGNRRKWAWDLGIPTGARLNKAVFQETRLTLEELEMAIAVELVEGLLGVGIKQDEVVERGEGGDAQSAGLSDVGEVVVEARDVVAERREEVVERGEVRGAEGVGVVAA